MLPLPRLLIPTLKHLLLPLSNQAIHINNSSSNNSNNYSSNNYSSRFKLSSKRKLGTMHKGSSILRPPPRRSTATTNSLPARKQPQLTQPRPLQHPPPGKLHTPTLSRLPPPHNSSSRATRIPKPQPHRLIRHRAIPSLRPPPTPRPQPPPRTPNNPQPPPRTPNNPQPPPHTPNPQLPPHTPNLRLNSRPLPSSRLHIKLPMLLTINNTLKFVSVADIMLHF
jgi:hypothetical protein